MVRLSKKVEYGLIAMRHIATKQQGDLLTAKEIADTNKIPYELLAKVLQRLSKAGLIISERGWFGRGKKAAVLLAGPNGAPAGRWRAQLSQRCI